MVKLTDTAGTEKPPTSKPPEPRLRSTTYGVWELLEEVTPWQTTWPSLSFTKSLSGFYEDWPLLYRFVLECTSLAEWRLGPWCALHLLGSLLPATTLWLSGKLLGSIEEIIEHKATTYWAFYMCATAILVLRWISVHSDDALYKIERVFKHRVTMHFSNHIIRARLRLDLPTYEDPVVSAKLAQLENSQPWDILRGAVAGCGLIVQIASQVSVLVSLVRAEEGAFFFAILACAQPLVQSVWNRRWPDIYYIYSPNVAYNRMGTLQTLAHESSYRKDIVGDGLSDYIQDEYEKAYAQLQEGSAEPIWTQLYNRPQDLTLTLISTIAEELPTIMFGMHSIRSGGSIPLKSLTLVGATTQSIGWTLSSVQRQWKDIADYRKFVKGLYDASHIENHLSEGSQSYPRPKCDGISAGMKIEFKDVSFQYPADSDHKNVLNGLSFTILPGQLCVIVGENGCGKSSTVQLLTRVYKPTKGQILIDDAPIDSYVAKDLRRATAALFQDFTHYPVTIRENIGFGDIDHINDLERIHTAAKLANAYDFITKLPEGFETNLGSKYTYSSSLSQAKDDGPLKVHIKQINPSPKFSGGQWQRIAVARTFMRSHGNDNVRLLVFDEPSSALDPKAEFELFEQLRAMRGQKSMIFITHRFGHLTKHADVILYMKDGAVVEQGTHAQLLEKKGDYQRLYNIQAQAFSD